MLLLRYRPLIFLSLSFLGLAVAVAVAAAFCPLPTTRNFSANNVNVNVHTLAAAAAVAATKARTTTRTCTRLQMPVGSSYGATTCLQAHGPHHQGRKFRFRKRAQQTLAKFAFALSVLTRAPSPSHAVAATSAPREELRANDIILNSLKPGISAEQADKLAAGIVEDEDDGDNVVLGQTATVQQDESAVLPKKSKLQKSLYDYGEDEYHDEEDEDLDFEFAGDVKESDVPKQVVPSGGGGGGGFAMASHSQPTTKMYVTCTFGILVVPVTWLQTREFLRGRREQAYVEKGLKILQAQKAEYFNVTSTSEDSDIEDELKDLKNKDDDDDNDDDDDDDDDDSDDDDDDDDEDDDRPSRRKKP